MELLEINSASFSSGFFINLNLIFLLFNACSISTSEYAGPMKLVLREKVRFSPWIQCATYSAAPILLPTSVGAKEI